MCSVNVIFRLSVSSASFSAPLLSLSARYLLATCQETKLRICQIACVTGKVSYGWLIVAFGTWTPVTAVTQTISKIWSQNLARVLFP